MRYIKFKTLEILILSVIVLLGAFLYLHKLGTIPPGLYVDEAATGYNAYCILKTGQDEYGQSFPTAMRLLGSYTPPLHIYLSIPIMAVLGLSVFSTRLLSAICGLLAIIILFFIIKELGIVKSKFTPLVTTLFFAITPWTVFFSRLGYEQNLAFLMFSVSVFLILKSLKNPRLVALTIPFISLTTYADWGQRFLSPLLFLGTFIIFRKRLLFKRNLKFLMVGIIVAFLSQIPNLKIINTASTFNKNEHFYSEVILTQAEKISHFLPLGAAISLAFTREFLSKFFTYFSPRSLFFLPDPDPQVSMPGLSIFYPWMIIPYLAGFYFLFKERKKPGGKLIIFLLLITPLPVALTHEPFHTQRVLALLLPLIMVMGLGVDKIIGKMNVKVWVPLFFFLILMSLTALWRSYFILLPQERAPIWGYGLTKLAEYIKAHPEEIFVIDQGKRTKPQDIAYIQLAFYLNLPPEKLQADQDPLIAKNYYNHVDFSFVHQFANIETKKIDWGETVWRNVVLVGDLASISDLEVKLHSLTPAFEIRDLNEQIILRGFKTNPKLPHSP